MGPFLQAFNDPRYKFLLSARFQGLLVLDQSFCFIHWPSKSVRQHVGVT